MFPYWLQPTGAALAGACLTILCFLAILRRRDRVSGQQMREVVDEYNQHLYAAWAKNDTAVNWRSASVGAGALVYNIRPGMSRAERRRLAREAAENHISNRRVARVHMPAMPASPEQADHYV